MAFRTEHAQIDGSINVDGSIFQWNTLFVGGSGGGGSASIGWGGGNFGSNNQLLTSGGDGSVVTETNATFDGTTLKITGDVSVTNTIKGNSDIITSFNVLGRNVYAIDVSAGLALTKLNATDPSLVYVQANWVRSASIGAGSRGVKWGVGYVDVSIGTGIKFDQGGIEPSLGQTLKFNVSSGIDVSISTVGPYLALTGDGLTVNPSLAFAALTAYKVDVSLGAAITWYGKTDVSFGAISTLVYNIEPSLGAIITWYGKTDVSLGPVFALYPKWDSSIGWLTGRVDKIESSLGIISGSNLGAYVLSASMGWGLYRNGSMWDVSAFQILLPQTSSSVATALTLAYNIEPSLGAIITWYGKTDVSFGAVSTLEYKQEVSLGPIYTLVYKNDVSFGGVSTLTYAHNASIASLMPRMNYVDSCLGVVANLNYKQDISIGLLNASLNNTLPIASWVDSSSQNNAKFIRDSSLNQSKFKWVAGLLEPSVAAGGISGDYVISGSIGAGSSGLKWDGAYVDISVSNTTGPNLIFVNGGLDVNASISYALALAPKHDASIGTLSTLVYNIEPSLGAIITWYGKTDISIGPIYTLVYKNDVSFGAVSTLDYKQEVSLGPVYTQFYKGLTIQGSIGGASQGLKWNGAYVDVSISNATGPNLIFVNGGLDVNASISYALTLAPKHDASIGTLSTLVYNIEPSLGAIITWYGKTDISIAPIYTLTYKSDPSLGAVIAWYGKADVSLGAISTLEYKQEVSLGPIYILTYKSDPSLGAAIAWYGKTDISFGAVSTLTYATNSSVNRILGDFVRSASVGGGGQGLKWNGAYIDISITSNLKFTNGALDTSIVSGGGGGGVGNVRWANGSLGTFSQMIVANGDGSIFARSNAVNDGNTFSIVGHVSIDGNYSCPSTHYYYLGTPTTVGSWRWSVEISTGDMLFEKNIAGVWTQKSKIS